MSIEFTKLISHFGKDKSRKKIWQLKAIIDDEKQEVKMITEFGEHGGRLKRYEKILIMHCEL